MSQADELLKFKELLDAGAITQEEFDAAKERLLGHTGASDTSQTIDATANVPTNNAPVNAQATPKKGFTAWGAASIICAVVSLGRISVLALVGICLGAFGLAKHKQKVLSIVGIVLSGFMLFAAMGASSNSNKAVTEEATAVETSDSSEQGDTELALSFDTKEQENGFDSKTNTTLAFHDYIFSIPSYWGDYTGKITDKMVYYYISDGTPYCMIGIGTTTVDEDDVKALESSESFPWDSYMEGVLSSLDNGKLSEYKTVNNRSGMASGTCVLSGYPWQFYMRVILSPETKQIYQVGLFQALDSVKSYSDDVDRVADAATAESATVGTDTTASTEEAATETSEATTDDEKVAEFRKKLTTALDASFGEGNYNIEICDAEGLVVSLWNDSITAAYTAALTGDSQAIANWNDVRSSCSSIVTTVYDSYKEYGFRTGEADVIFLFATNSSLDNVVLGYSSGECIMDQVAILNNSN